MAGEKIKVIIVDDIAETRENIRKLLQFDADMEVVGMARTGAEGIQISLDTKPDVVLMDINMPDMDGITATERIRGRLPATQIIILSVQSDSNYMRKAMLAGARDFLTKPPDVDDLMAAIRRAGEMAHNEKIKEANTMAAVQASQQGNTGSLSFSGGVIGKVITVYSPKGGTGSTTVAANLAVALQTDETPVALVDGRLQFGDIGFFFNEQARNNIIDLASRGEDLDADVVREVMIPNEKSGVHLLVAPHKPEQADEVTGNQFSHVISFLKRLYTYVIIDTSSSLDGISIGALDQSDVVVMVTTQDIPSIKNLRLFLNLKDMLGLIDEQLMVVLNRWDKRRSITGARIADITKIEVVSIIPMDERLIIPAMDRGEPFMIANKSSGAVKAMRQLATAVKKRIDELESVESNSF
jgi:pilus assembly protein CpaE